MFKIIQQIFDGREVSNINDIRSELFVGRFDSIEVPMDIFRTLKLQEILIHDSGNFETGVKYYRFNPEYRGKDITIQLSTKNQKDLKEVQRKLNLILLGI